MVKKKKKFSEDYTVLFTVTNLLHSLLLSLCQHHDFISGFNKEYVGRYYLEIKRGVNEIKITLFCPFTFFLFSLLGIEHTYQLVSLFSKRPIPGFSSGLSSCSLVLSCHSTSLKPSTQYFGFLPEFIISTLFSSLQFIIKGISELSMGAQLMYGVCSTIIIHHKIWDVKDVHLY